MSKAGLGREQSLSKAFWHFLICHLNLVPRGQVCFSRCLTGRALGGRGIGTPPRASCLLPKPLCEPVLGLELTPTSESLCCDPCKLWLLLFTIMNCTLECKRDRRRKALWGGLCRSVCPLKEQISQFVFPI